MCFRVSRVEFTNVTGHINMKSQQLRPGFIAAVPAVLITSNYFVAGTLSQGSVADAVNLVKNPSLELGVGDPTCFSMSAWGTEGNRTILAGRIGGRPASVPIQGYAPGDRQLLQTETADYAPAVKAALTTPFRFGTNPRQPSPS
jgi:hypothetical protein